MVANARTLAHELMQRQFRLVSGGTDNHLMLVDVTSRGLTGKVAEKALDAAGITVNRNGIPFDTRPPLDPSGIRIGTPALTTRGMKETEMRQIAGWIGEVLASPDGRGLAVSHPRASGGVVPAIPRAGRLMRRLAERRRLAATRSPTGAEREAPRSAPRRG